MKSFGLIVLICIAPAVIAGFGLWLAFPSWPRWVALVLGLLVAATAYQGLLQR